MVRRMGHDDPGSAAAHWPWYQPWAAIALASGALNLAWELMAMSRYDVLTGTRGQPGHFTGCLVATVGDVGIALVSYAGASAVCAQDWIRHPRVLPATITLVSGLLITAVLEYVNVHVLHRWTYGAGMLLLAGIGTVPLIQWLVIPPVVLWLTHRHFAGRPLERIHGGDR